AGNWAYLRIVRHCPSESFNSRSSLVRESVGREVVSPLPTLFCSSCVDGFSFLAMFWYLSLGRRPSPHMPREEIPRTVPRQVPREGRCWAVRFEPRIPPMSALTKLAGKVTTKNTRTDPIRPATSKMTTLRLIPLGVGE